MKIVTLTLGLLFSFYLTAQESSQAVVKLTFPSKDDVTVTADYYPGEASNSPLIILCHQAGWSRGEYLEIAPKLTQLGYACLAIDQRSGKEINNIKNETHLAAEKLGKSTNYLDAEQDIEAAIAYAKKTFPSKSELILWGSSYSASLVLKIGAENDNVDAVVSFSPGEYFERLGESDHFIADAAAKLDKPVFITSSKEEAGSWATIFSQIPAENKVGFVPQGNGKHGSRNLWEKFPDHQEYWDAITNFLLAL